MAWIGLTLGPETPYEDLIAIINEIITRLDDENITKIIKNGNTERIIFGQRADGTYGLDISKEGKGVTTASDDELIMSSRFNMFKIVESDTFTIPSFDVASGAKESSTKIITHNLGFKPTVFAYASNGGGGRTLWGGQTRINQYLNQLTSSGGTDFIGIAQLEDYQLLVTDTEVSFTIEVENATGSTYTVDEINTKYYILQETIE